MFANDTRQASFDLFDHFDRDLAIRERWPVDGRHYARTCEAWLANLDANRPQLLRLFERQYPPAEARIRLRRWRIFLLACAELFGYADGSEWIVGHYLFEPTRGRIAPELQAETGRRNG